MRWDGMCAERRGRTTDREDGLVFIEADCEFSKILGTKFRDTTKVKEEEKRRRRRRTRCLLPSSTVTGEGIGHDIPREQ